MRRTNRGYRLPAHSSKGGSLVSGWDSKAGQGLEGFTGRGRGHCGPCSEAVPRRLEVVAWKRDWSGECRGLPRVVLSWGGVGGHPWPSLSLPAEGGAGMPGLCRLLVGQCPLPHMIAPGCSVSHLVLRTLPSHVWAEHSSVGSFRSRRMLGYF